MLTGLRATLICIWSPKWVVFGVVFGNQTIEQWDGRRDPGC